MKQSFWQKRIILRPLNEIETVSSSLRFATKCPLNSKYDKNLSRVSDVFTDLIVKLGRNVFKTLFSRYQLLNEYLSGRENSSHSTVS